MPHRFLTATALVLVALATSCKSGAARARFLIGPSELEVDNPAATEFTGLGFGGEFKIGGSLGGTELEPGPIELGGRVQFLNRVLEQDVSGFDTQVRALDIGVGPYVRLNTRNLLKKGGVNFFLEAFVGVSTVLAEIEAGGAEVDYDGSTTHVGGSAGIEISLGDEHHSTLDLGLTVMGSRFEPDEDTLAEADLRDVLFFIGSGTRF